MLCLWLVTQLVWAFSGVQQLRLHLRSAILLFSFQLLMCVRM